MPKNHDQPKFSRAPTAEEELECSRQMYILEQRFQAAFQESRSRDGHAKRLSVYKSVIRNLIEHPRNLEVERNPRRVRLDKLRRVLPTEALMAPFKALGFVERVGGDPLVTYLVLDDRPATLDSPGTQALVACAGRLVDAAGVS